MEEKKQKEEEQELAPEEKNIGEVYKLWSNPRSRGFAGRQKKQV